MDELDIAKKLIDDANTMIDERNQKMEDANVYRNVIRHGGDREGLKKQRMARLQFEASALQEQIDYNLAFAENILSRVAAEITDHGKKTN